MKGHIFIFTFSFIASFALINAVKFIADKYNLAKRNREPSRLGGLAFCASFYLSIFLNQSLKIISLPQNLFYGFIFSSLLIFWLGIIDDFKELGFAVKLITQIISALILVYFDIKIKIYFLSPVVNTALTILWIVTIINAFNLLDILDGLAAGISLISAGTFFILSILTNNPYTAVLSLNICAVLIPFLIFNLKPAKIFMGDTGSMFLGLFLGFCAISISYASEDNPLALVTPLIVLGLPLYDITFVTLMRIFKGLSPFLKSKDHFSLRLIYKGYDHKKTTIIMYLFCVAFCVLSLITLKLPNIFIVLTLIISAAILIFLSRKAALVKV